MFARHSSGSNGWREMWGLKVSGRSNLLDLFAQAIENQIATRGKNAAHVSDLKSFALQVQVPDHGNGSERQFRAGLLNNTLRDAIPLFCRFDNVFAESG